MRLLVSRLWSIKSRDLHFNLYISIGTIVVVARNRYRFSLISPFSTRTVSDAVIPAIADPRDDLSSRTEYALFNWERKKSPCCDINARMCVHVSVARIIRWRLWCLCASVKAETESRGETAPGEQWDYIILVELFIEHCGGKIEARHVWYAATRYAL